MPIQNALPCHLATMRQAARMAMQFYRRALAPVDLEPTHFSFLKVLRRVPGQSNVELAARMLMDHTTVTRTLALMEQQDLIEKHRGADRRETRWILTPHGSSTLDQAMPHWIAAQTEFGELLGAQQTAELHRMNFELATRIARREQQP